MIIFVMFSALFFCFFLTVIFLLLFFCFFFIYIESRLLLSTIQTKGQRYRYRLIINILRGSKSKKIVSKNFHNLIQNNQRKGNNQKNKKKYYKILNFFLIKLTINNLLTKN